MTTKTQRSAIARIADFITFPLRALLFPAKGKFGLSSLQDERMRIVASFCKGKVLDIGCGHRTRFIKEFIGEHKGIGIDVYPYDGVSNVIEDMTSMPFENCAFDTITLIAVGGHIPKSKRIAEFKEFARLLKTDGLLIVTEGEPITQFLSHKYRSFMFHVTGNAAMDVDSERGMEEDEEYCMPKKELLSYLSTPPFRLINRKRFMWLLNNVYVAKKNNTP